MATETNEPDTLENDEARIRACTTLEEINEQSDLLLEQLQKLKHNKTKLGYDVSYEYDQLKRKLKLVGETKEKIKLNKISSRKGRLHFQIFLFNKLIFDTNLRTRNYFYSKKL